MDSFEKQPYEEFPIASGFNKKGKTFAAGEHIVSQEVIITDNFGTNVTTATTVADSVINDGASKVLVKVKGGSEDYSPYKITFRCTTNLGNKYENDVKMKVSDK